MDEEDKMEAQQERIISAIEKIAEALAAIAGEMSRPRIKKEMEEQEARDRARARGW